MLEFWSDNEFRVHLVFCDFLLRCFMEPRALQMIGKYSISDRHLQPTSLISNKSYGVNLSYTHSEISQGTFEMSPIQSVTKIRQEALCPVDKRRLGGNKTTSGLFELV
jgi:hypothetical protein